jgi:hypothetical protein
MDCQCLAKTTLENSLLILHVKIPTAKGSRKYYARKILPQNATFHKIYKKTCGYHVAAKQTIKNPPANMQEEKMQK